MADTLLVWATEVLEVVFGGFGSTAGKKKEGGDFLRFVKVRGLDDATREGEH